MTDAIVIGSGHNGLVAAAYMARAGLRVEVLERNPRAGGAVLSEELTEPGFVHDTFSAWHPLFKLSGAFAELGGELEARGLAYAESPEETTANVRRDGRAVIAYRDPHQTAEGLDAEDRAAYLSEIERFGSTIGTVGALLGALFLGILNDGLTIKGVNANYLDLYLGLAILIAMAFNVYVQRVRRGSGRG